VSSDTQNSPKLFSAKIKYKGINHHRASADVKELTNPGDRGGILDCVFAQLSTIDEEYETSSVLLIPSRFCHLLNA
jgi:hypothetical protein